MVTMKDEKTTDKTYSIMGFPVCKVNKDIHRKQKILFNVIKKDRIYSNFLEKEEITIKNRIIYRKTEDSNYIEYSIPGVLTHRINKLKKVQKILDKTVDKKFNKIFILRSNLGEAYIFLKFIINELISPQDTPLIITANKAHLELIEMFGLQIETQLIKKYKYEINEPVFKIGLQTYYMVYGIDFYINAENKINETNTHYLNYIFEHFGLTKSYLSKNVNKIKISDDTKKFVNDYIIRNNLSKFVFLADKATTCTNIDEGFWTRLQERLGLTIVKNSKELSIEEAYELANRAHIIITLRSGLSEILTETNNLQVAIYTDFRQRSRFEPLTKDRVINGYTLKKICANNKYIFEIEYDETNENKIIEGIEKLINMRELVYENNNTSRW